MESESPHADPIMPYRRWYGFKRIMTVLASVLLLVLLGFVGLVFAWSPGRVAPLVDAAGQPIAGSLSERVFVKINGVQQGMLIQSVNPSNPVLLFLHGGPGMPQFFLNGTHPTGLEQDFTVVWWEQRGAGISFSSDIPPESMTINQMIEDTIAVADYLRKRFGRDRIVLLGHSWGSFLGIQVAARAPDRFSAFIGMGQVVHQLRSEVEAHDHLLEAWHARGDLAMVRKLEAAPVSMTYGVSDAWMRLRDEALHGLGVGTTRDMDSVITGVFLPIWRSRAYTVGEKIAVWRGMAWSRSFLWNEFLRTDLATRVTRLEIPVYFFIGEHDYTTSFALARAYFGLIKAPVKGYYTFHDSAHSPLFEEPQRARLILQQDVLKGKNSLADVIQ
jgi:pimeloyl-ACP methyl ester carboxylesterase